MIAVRNRMETVRIQTVYRKIQDKNIVIELTIELTLFITTTSASIPKLAHKLGILNLSIG